MLKWQYFWPFDLKKQKQLNSKRYLIDLIPKVYII